MNHLWQSTAVILVAWLLTISLRDNPARIRYAIWMIASIKFLFPFALLTRIGEHWAKPVFTKPGATCGVLGHRRVRRAIPQVPVPGSGRMAAYSMHDGSIFNMPALLIAGIWVCGFLAVLARGLAWRMTAALAREAEPVSEGREFDALRLAERERNSKNRLPCVFSREDRAGSIRHDSACLAVADWSLERLDDVQIDAIMVHEVEHVRRRDNLTTAIHAAVEALFWFHPLVRWMTSRLNEERERACDESVIERNAKPEVYADSILKVCAFCLEPATPCVSGVSGADLKERILRIMARRSGTALNSWRKILLASAAILALAMPVGIGVCMDRPLLAPTTRDRLRQSQLTFRSTTWPVSSHTKPTIDES